jgi:lipopolysaccharide/colanic/teichoic acid biosynthesis glycosyltransferase
MMLADDSTPPVRPAEASRETTADLPTLAQTQPELPVWRSDGPHTPTELVPGLPPESWYLTFKVVLEFAIALVLLILSVPVIAVMAVLVKLTSRGPVFYSQVRLGRRGREFHLHKIRTMFHDCEKVSGPRWSVPGDPRVTPLGRFLRQTHLDELPQLWNVLRGEMSLVGPRPERPVFVADLQRQVAHYADRLAVRPGVTGLAQVQLPGDTDLASVRRKLAYDLYYIRHIGLWLDLRLMLCTGAHMVGVPFHILCRIFAMPRREAVEHHYRARQTSATAVAACEQV